MFMEEVHYVINSQSKPLVRIKGVKEGLYFILDDSSDWQLVLDELEYKLMKSHQNILSGPIMDVFVKLGRRELTEEINFEAIDDAIPAITYDTQRIIEPPFKRGVRRYSLLPF